MMLFENVLLDNDQPNVEEILDVLRQGYNPKKSDEKNISK
jgi:hypothetical protein